MVVPEQPRSLHTASLLANVQQDLEILFTSTSESILLIEANGIILAANDVSAKWLERSAESLTGENLFQLLTPSGIPIREWVHEAVNKKTIHESDALFGERFIHVRLIPITSGDKVRRLIIMGQDVTEHKQVEKQVREFTGQMELKVRERTKELEALNQKLTEDRQRAELLASFSLRLMQDTQDYGHLLEHITTEISKMIGDTCMIAVFMSDLTLMEVRAIADRDIESLPRQRDQLLSRTISVETNAIVSSILKGKRSSEKEITREKGTDLLPPEFAALLGKDGLIALEVFPLHASDQPLGMLAIAREHGEYYTEDEISFVGSLASSIALAIQNARLFEQFSESQNQLRGLSQQLVQMQENQYRHLAKELHDRVGQDMTAININLNIMQTLLPQTISKDVISRLADTEKLVQESVARMRSIMAEFRPPMLDQYGLAAALYWYSEQYTRRTNIAVKVDDQYLKDTRLPSELEIALFRIAQEALNNAAKHAKASQVNIELMESQGNILMTITDDGVGFDTKTQGISSPGHWGVTNMQERARAINGELLLRSVPGQGTQIAVRVRKKQ
jgi:signal transduction histidine kinase